jgi:hypothetical protein
MNPSGSVSLSEMFAIRSNPALGAISDASAIARAHLVALRSEIASASAKSSGISKAHLQELVAKIDEAFNPVSKISSK